MSKRLSVGDTVQCRLYNTPEHKHYGDMFIAKITDIQKRTFTTSWGRIYPYYPTEYNYTVIRSDNSAIVLHRNEIIRRIKKG